MDYTATGYQANVAKSGSNYATSSFGQQAAQRANGDILDPGTGAWVPAGSPVLTKQGFGGGAASSKTTADAQKFANARNAAEVAELDQQEVEDRISENKSRNAGMTSTAFANAQRSTQLGRGLFQRRQSGTKLSSALGALNAGNAGALKAARMKTLQAKQGADLTRTNPDLGYRVAVTELNKKLLGG